MTAIKFEKVHFSYADDEQTEEFFAEEKAFSLDGVDFSVEEGEFVAVLGHNGSGKSTLARLTNGLLSPTDGEITVFGLDAKNPKNLFEIRKQVGIVFQNPDNQTVASIVEDDVAKLLDRQSFAGSTATADRLYKTMAGAIGKDMVALSKMASLTPARVMGWTDRGEIAVGKRADLLVINEELIVEKIIFKGKNI